jgi:5-methylcytosine-specific restriction endonuclease McrBC GTP-binding regulatory subunit McrB
MGTSILKWDRVAPDSFDLRLQNVDSLDLNALRTLYETFVSTKWADSDLGINKYLREDLKSWIDVPAQPLASRVYVTLSNWFSSIDAFKNSDRGNAAGALWDFLFLCRPSDRLSPTEAGKNHVLIPERFDTWWAEQQKLQGSTQSLQVSRKGDDVADARFAEICKSTFLPQMFFENLERVLTTKKQLILQGAPGTGKTFIGEKLAEWWTGQNDRVHVIQFHESYGYEDFVQGIRPTTDPGTHQTSFELRNGFFMNFCGLARTSPTDRFVLLIDEINRAKTSRVFGELLYLLEYRKKTVVLQSGAKFSIPENVYIIGTMNTLDKSIALVDYALRRRFAFETLVPVRDGKSIVLRGWLDAHGIANADEIERLFLALNKEVSTQDEGLMIGHSYFMSDEIAKTMKYDARTLEFIWHYYILPLVSEYEYELTDADIQEKFGLPAIRRAAGLD